MVGGIENEGESVPKSRKSHPPSLKAKVAVEAIKAHKTAAQIAQMFGVHPTQVGDSRQPLLAEYALRQLISTHLQYLFVGHAHLAQSRLLYGHLHNGLFHVVLDPILRTRLG
jgi:hypothetical protein